MRLKRFCLAAITALAMLGSQTQAQIITSDTEPNTNILLDNLSNGSSTGGVINASATQGARGTEFSVGVAGEMLNINSLIIQANNPDTFAAGENFTVALFSGVPGTFTAPGTFANVNPGYLDANTGLSLEYSETFAANTATSTGANGAADGAVGNNDYVKFNFAAPVLVNGGQSLHAFVFTDFAFSQREGANNGGGRLQFRENSTALNPSGSRDFNFAIHGEVVEVPEPTTAAVLGLGTLGMLMRRRRG